MELPFTEALAMTRTGQIADAKTIMLLQWAALDGPFRADTRAEMRVIGQETIQAPRSTPLRDGIL